MASSCSPVWVFECVYVHTRPTQSMIYVPVLVNKFQKSVLLIVHYKYSKSCYGDFILQNLILRTRSCSISFITEPSWLLHFHPTKMVGRKSFVPLRYQLRRSILGGPTLKYVCMIHWVGRICIYERICTRIHRFMRMNRFGYQSRFQQVRAREFEYVLVCGYIYVHRYVYMYACINVHI